MFRKPANYKYTEEVVNKELDALIEMAHKDQENAVLGKLFEQRGYSIKRLSEWASRFDEETGIPDKIATLKQIFENRINQRGLEGKYNPAIAIINLKNNYGWTDRTSQEVTLQASHSIVPPDEKALQEAAKAYEKARQLKLS